MFVTDCTETCPFQCGTSCSFGKLSIWRTFSSQSTSGPTALRYTLNIRLIGGIIPGPLLLLCMSWTHPTSGLWNHNPSLVQAHLLYMKNYYPIRSQFCTYHNSYAVVTTAMLSWHVQNSTLIATLELRLKHNEPVLTCTKLWPDWIITMKTQHKEYYIHNYEFINRSWNGTLFTWLPRLLWHSTELFSVDGFNSLRPSDAYMRQLTRPSLVQIMACRLVGTKPISEPTLVYCQLDPWEWTSVKYQWKLKHFHLEKCVNNRRLRNVGHLVSASMYVLNNAQLASSSGNSCMNMLWINQKMLIQFLCLLSSQEFDCNIECVKHSSVELSGWWSNRQQFSIGSSDW